MSDQANGGDNPSNIDFGGDRPSAGPRKRARREADNSNKEGISEANTEANSQIDRRSNNPVPGRSRRSPAEMRHAAQRDIRNIRDERIGEIVEVAHQYLDRESSASDLEDHSVDDDTEYTSTMSTSSSSISTPSPSSTSSSSEFSNNNQPHAVAVDSYYLRCQAERLSKARTMESSVEASRETNIVTVAIMEEVWNHYQQHAQPVLHLKEKFLNVAAIKFLQYQLSCGQQNTMPQSLNIGHCTFSNNAQLEMTLKHLSAFVKQNADQWKHLRMLGMCMRVPRELHEYTIDSQSFYAQRGNFVGTLLPINLREPMESALTRLPVLCNHLNSLELGFVDLVSPNTGALLKNWLGSTDNPCPVSTLKLEHCYIHLGNVWKPLMAGLQVHTRQRLHSLVIKDCDTGAGKLCGESLQTLVSIGLKGAIDDPKSQLTSLDMSRASPDGIADNSGFSSSLNGQVALSFFTQTLTGLQSLESINLSAHRDLFPFMEKEEMREDEEGKVTPLMKFLEALTQHPRLKNIDLSSCEIKPFIARSLLKRLCENKSTTVLETLNLKFNRFRLHRAIPYFHRLPPSLHRLYMDHPRNAWCGRDLFRDALSRNLYLFECPGVEQDVMYVLRRNRMLRIANSTLSIQPLSLWSKLFEVIPEKEDATALFAALKEACPVLTEEQE